MGATIGTVRLHHSGCKWYAVPVRDEEVPYYWGFKVVEANDLGEVVEGDWDLKIATSRLGSPISDIWNRLSSDYEKSHRVLIAFGSPTEGLWEIASRIGLDLMRDFNYVVNFIPYQGVETVRTEEAIMAVLEYFTLLEG